MKVRITDKSIDRDLSLDVLTVDEFNDIAFHPYLQSIQWDAVIIDICPKLMRSYISQVFKRNYRMVPVIESYPISTKEVLMLTTMLPQHCAELMAAHKEGTLEALMNRLSNTYKWNMLV